MKFAVTIALITAAVAGCATYQAYDGPSRAAQEITTIHGDAKLRAQLPLALVIRSVDGRAVDLRYSSVAVAKGHHSLIVDCQVGGATGSTSRHHVELDAEGGESYRLRAQMRHGNRSCESVVLDAL